MESRKEAEHTEELRRSCVSNDKTQEEYDTLLRKVLSKLQAGKIKLYVKNLQISVRSLEFLGDLVKQDGIRIHLDKVRAVTEMEPPKDKKSVKRLFSLTKFLAKEILEPLQALLKN